MRTLKKINNFINKLTGHIWENGNEMIKVSFIEGDIEIFLTPYLQLPSSCTIVWYSFIQTVILNISPLTSNNDLNLTSKIPFGDTTERENNIYNTIVKNIFFIISNLSN